MNSFRLRKYRTYLVAIGNSVGTKMFRHLFAEVDGRLTDITRAGGLSCAFFASSVLVMFGLIKSQHGTVAGTVADLERSGWKKARSPRPGAVLVWEARRGSDGAMHKHIGFYLGDEKAVSNGSAASRPTRHHWTFGARSPRKVEAIWWKPGLEKM